MVIAFVTATTVAFVALVRRRTRQRTHVRHLVVVRRCALAIVVFVIVVVVIVLKIEGLVEAVGLGQLAPLCFRCLGLLAVTVVVVVVVYGRLAFDFDLDGRNLLLLLLVLFCMLVVVAVVVVSLVVWREGARARV